tara:strand:+ start:282 stop:440 length:159 start_codon:yes stop_codon:yes gene_type:complete
VLGELTEDTIPSILDKKEIKNLIKGTKNKFNIPVESIRSTIMRPKIYSNGNK